MKVCLRCRTGFEASGWCCPQCAFTPSICDGYLTFAPELALENDGFGGHYFADLALREAANFWFRSRNRLLVWALRRYFPHATSLLEIGCGTGFVLAGLRQAFPNMRLAASDIFTEGLSFAGHRTPAADLFQMDARRIPFAHEFDVVGAFDVLEHIEEDRAVLRQMYHATRPGGGILVTVPQHRFLWSVVDEYSYHKRRYTRTELLTKVEGAGFRVMRVTSFVSLLLPAMAAARLRQRPPDEQFNPAAEFQISPWLNQLFEQTLRAEQKLIEQGVSFPAGGSLLLVATRL